MAYSYIKISFGAGNSRLLSREENWEVIDTINGVKSSAMIYGIAETAKANNLKPYEYFKYQLEIIPQHMEDTDREFLKDFVTLVTKLTSGNQKT